MNTRAFVDKLYVSLSPVARFLTSLGAGLSLPVDLVLMWRREAWLLWDGDDE